MARGVGLTWDGQPDFRSGAFPGLEEIPLNGCEEILDGLLAEDGALQRRGGTTYKTTTDTADNILGAWDGYLAAGPRTILTDPSTVYILGLDDATPQSLLNAQTRVGRWTEISHMLIRPLSPPNQQTFLIVGGAQPFAEFNSGTASLTQGSRTVTGSSTNWATVPPGAILTVAGQRPTVIGSAQSNTSLTLAEPWPHGAASGAFTIRAALAFPSPDGGAVANTYPAYLNTMYDRLLLGSGNRVSFTHFNQTDDGRVLPAPLDFVGTTDFHLLPEGVIVTALEPLRDTLLIFTTQGVWTLSGLAFDIVDAFGNPQHRLESFSRDLILWGEPGLASWKTAIIAPAVDDVYLLGGGAPEAITGGGRKVYRDHVKAGAQPGQAAVYRGHYLLPILDQTNNPIDLLVWRLDMPGVPFTRWSGHGGRPRGFTVRAGSTTRQPDLFGGVNRRLESYLSVFSPSGTVKNDADGSTHEMAVTLRTFSSGTLQHMWRRLRVRTEQDDAGADDPTWTAEVAVGRPGNPFEVLGDPMVRDGR